MSILASLFLYSDADTLRLRAVDQEEAAKVRKEEARNTLESYLYQLRDLLDEGNKDTPFKQCSQPSERSALTAKLEETFEWLHDKGDYAETSQLLDKRLSLEYVIVCTILTLFLTYILQNHGAPNYPSIPRNRSLPSGLEQQPNVELEYQVVLDRGKAKLDC